MIDLIEAKDNRFAIRVVDAEAPTRGRELFRIMGDGTLIRGPGFTTMDEMSLLFWRKLEAISRQHGGLPKSEVPS